MAFTADEVFDLLQGAHANGRLAHAYLITGPVEAELPTLALRLAKMLLGYTDNHPDLHTVAPESKSRVIRGEQMRAMEAKLYKRPQLGGFKAGLVFDAERMNDTAANAFLKTLEEPPPKTHLFLITNEPQRLLETILSRCLEVAVRPVKARAQSARQSALLEMLSGFSKNTAPDMAQALVLAREFQRLLGEAKEEHTTLAEASYKEEEKRFKQATDLRKEWFEDREDYYKALGEARYRGERAILLGTLEEWWGDVLRQQSAAEHLDHPAFTAETAAIAARHPIPEALRRAGAVGRLREHLDRTVNESLAIEVAFLEAFAA